MVGRWGQIPQTKPKHIALHQALGIDISQRIPDRTLDAIINTPIGGYITVGYGGRRILVTTQLKYAANFARNTGQFQGGGF